MAEDDSTYVFTEDVSETAKPSTPVTKATLRICYMATPITKPSGKRQRKIKLLPKSIAEMTSTDSHHLIILEELDPHSKSKTYGKSMHVVSRVKGIEPTDDNVVLDHLTTDQVHLFARNIGVPNLRSKNKFICRLTMVSDFKFQHHLSSFGLSPTAQANQTTANVCRSVNVIFSDEFIEELKKVNDKKSRADHETWNTHKNFWIWAAMPYNKRQDDDVVEEGSSEPTAVAIPEENESTTEDEFTTLIVSYEVPVLADLDTNEEVDLAQIEQMETNAFRKKCLDLFKVRSIMKENMTKSGTHDGDPYNFVKVAMRGFTGLTPISVYISTSGVTNTH